MSATLGSLVMTTSASSPRPAGVHTLAAPAAFLENGAALGPGGVFNFNQPALVRRLGEPVFLHAADGDDGAAACFILADGSEGDIAFGRASQFTHMQQGPYRILLDKMGLLQGAIFEGYVPPVSEQLQTLDGLISWFWHDLSHHFLTPLARGQLWSAAGALEDLRRTCVNLARLRHDFAARAEGYEKVEQTPAVAQLAPLAATYGPLEPGALLQAAGRIVQCYRELAPELAQTHGLRYPTALDRLLSARLERAGADHAAPSVGA